MKKTSGAMLGPSLCPVGHLGDLLVRTGQVAASILVWLLVTGAPRADAFDVVRRGGADDYVKWGASTRAGTSGGVVTWGFVAAGTPGGGDCGPYCEGKSLDVLPNFYPAPDTSHDRQPIDIERLVPIFDAAFDAWSAEADIRFRYVGIDDSLKRIDDATSTTPMIRIGIWQFGGMCAYFTAGAAFPPRLRSGSNVGRIFINANVGYQMSTAPEGARLQDFPVGGGLHMTDVLVLALHEIGHVIGLAGSDDPDSLMWQPKDPDPALRPTFALHKPRADDAAGARFLYGPPPPRSDAGRSAHPAAKRSP